MDESPESHARTGIHGLDDILHGGLTRDRVYLIEGTPGCGKTTLALQYLIEGIKNGDKGLYVTLSETKNELISVARSHGMKIDGFEILELIAEEGELNPDNQFTMFQPSEVQMTETTRRILEIVDSKKPARVVIDSLSEMRLLAQNPLRYRRQVLALKQYFMGRGCTVLLLDDKTSDAEDLQLRSIAHAVISLDQMSPEYGAERRRLRVTKFRGRKYKGGYHDFVIDRGGLEVFPRLVALDHSLDQPGGQLKSGVVQLDALLGDGIEYGTSVLLLGPAGVGKSSITTLYAKAAADRGDRSAIFLFDESKETLVGRSIKLGMSVAKHIDNGLITVQRVDPAEMSPGEFGALIRSAVDGTDGLPGAKVVVIDSLNGYLNAMPEERFLIIQLHEILTYLARKGAVSFLVVAQHGILGDSMKSPVDTSYLADGVILFRYFETHGEVRQAISVVKKRSGRHERSIRELRLTEQGIKVGEPLREFHGVLKGTPDFLAANSSGMVAENG